MEYASDQNVFTYPFSFLVVDDHDFMQYLIMELLRSADARSVERAFNGLEAIEVLKSMRSVDFIITDFNMPKMNGLELLKAIRVGETPVDRETLVVMLSGFSDDALLVTASQLDANGYVPKPVSKNVLVKRLNQVFLSGTKLKSVEEYREVGLPEIGGSYQAEKSAVQRRRGWTASATEESRARGTSMPLDQLTVGSVFAEDVVTANGVTLARAGEQVAQGLLDLLQQTREITKIHEVSVLVL